jgi:hypothetical protein
LGKLYFKSLSNLGLSRYSNVIGNNITQAIREKYIVRSILLEKACLLKNNNGEFNFYFEIVVCVDH